jgi:hypothetical protein
MIDYMEDKIGIILVVTNEKNQIKLLYESIAKQNYENYSIYFIDNNSLDGSQEYSRILNTGLNLDIHYITLKVNSGFARGNNIGAEAAIKDGCEYIFVLNPDMELAENTLDILLKTCQSDSKIGVCSSVLLFGGKNKTDLKIQLYGGKVNLNTQKKTFLHVNQYLRNIDLPKILRVDFVNGGSTFIRKNVINECGLFEEKYFIYNDEIDLAFRIKKAGYLMVVTSSTKIWHHHDWSKKSNNKFNFMYYYMMRNRFLYYKKYRLYFNLIIDLLIQLITFPIKIKWAIKISNIRLLKYYYMGLWRGICGETGIAIMDFNK